MVFHDDVGLRKDGKVVGGGKNGKPKVGLNRIKKNKREEVVKEIWHKTYERRGMVLRKVSNMKGCMAKCRENKCVIGGAEEGRKEVGKRGEEDKNQSRGQ